MKEAAGRPGEARKRRLDQNGKVSHYLAILNLTVSGAIRGDAEQSR